MLSLKRVDFIFNSSPYESIKIILKILIKICCYRARLKQINEFVEETKARIESKKNIFKIEEDVNLTSINCEENTKSGLKFK